MKKKNNFWSNGISIDESKISVLILVFLIGSGFAFYQVIVEKDIAPGLLSFLLYLIGGIAGINISDSIINGINSKGKTEQSVQYDQFNNDYEDLRGGKNDVV